MTDKNLRTLGYSEKTAHVKHCIAAHRFSARVADKYAHAKVSAIRSFYATFGITVRMRGRQRLPKPRLKTNE